MWNTKKTYGCKIIRLNKIYKFRLTVSDKMYIFYFNFKKRHWNSKILFFKQNIWEWKKTFRWKIIFSNKVYKFSLEHFWRDVYFMFWFQKTQLKIKNSIFLTKIREIRNRRKNVKSFAWIKSTIFGTIFSRYSEKN